MHRNRWTFWQCPDDLCERLSKKACAELGLAQFKIVQIWLPIALGKRELLTGDSDLAGTGAAELGKSEPIFLKLVRILRQTQRDKGEKKAQFSAMVNLFVCCGSDDNSKSVKPIYKHENP
ncbi:MAG: hypothetical protein H7245_22005 [Candidatus Saccharibacteria bacterium]|nr:hypothetical protein [Pseudorhodobacter sp.]